ncbi:competence pheromone ComX [Bacillus lacus]|uniref:ComX pheromone n=1 Tax=Metabacillus lacus TaxID=1983721 RepID=A0A7X2J1G3_9BACI|nr:competence pheromone ComX [Metabacillus lacus]MRX73569.1 competence pheromone ComX [Metabacillus lacus]
MQEIVNYLVSNPEVFEKVVSGEVSLLNVKSVEEVIGLVEGILGAGKTTVAFWW